MGKLTKLTETQFRIIIAVVVLFFIGMVYIAILEDRLKVKEWEGFIENPIISQTHPLRYKTEFCASKLTDLAHEIHFLELDIEKQKNVTSDYGKGLQTLEENITSVEQRAIPQIREEFDEYRKLCDQFDIAPNKEICDRFLKESGQSLELAQENAKVAESKGILEQLDISFHELRKTKRIYDNLQSICAEVG